MSKNKKTYQKWLIAGVATVIIVALFTLGGVAHTLSDLVALIIIIAIMVAIVTLFVSGLQYVFRKIRQPKKSAEQPTDAMLAHYREAGMSDSEIDFFRDTMQQAEQEINQLATNMQAAPKLKAVDLNHDTTKVAQALFKEIVKSPKRLHLAGDFLYKHLPSLVAMSQRYLEINHHEVKTADTYTVLDKSIEALNELSHQLKKDYTAFVADDLDDLDTNISVAEAGLDQTDDTTKEHDDDHAGN